MAPIRLPLERLTETAQADPRLSVAASMLRQSTHVRLLSPMTKARIKARLGVRSRRALIGRMPTWRFLRAGAVLVVALGVLNGSAFAGYRLIMAAGKYVADVRAGRSALPGALGAHPESGRVEVASIAVPGEVAISPPDETSMKGSGFEKAVHSPLPLGPMPAAKSATALRHHRTVPAASVPLAAAGHATAFHSRTGYNSMGLEAAELERGLAQKEHGELASAIATLGSYRRAHPHGSFIGEASLSQLDAELRLGRKAEALDLLRELVTDPSLPRWDELRLLRAVWASPAALGAAPLPVFDDSAAVPALAERALYGRAVCLQAVGRLDESRRAFEAVLERYPTGQLSTEARRALGSSK